MPSWLDTVDDAAIRATVDAGTLARGRDYARRGFVRDLEVSPQALTAFVTGSGRSYRTHVEAYTGRSPRRRFVGTCTCPVGDDCKHAVAVLLAARAGAGVAAAASWEQAVAQLLVAPPGPPAVARSTPTRDLVLLARIDRTVPAPARHWGARPAGPSVRVMVRPVLYDPGGRTSAVTWASLVAGGHDVPADQRDAIVALFGLFQAHREHAYPNRPQPAIPLHECGPGVWAALAHLAVTGVVLAPEPETHRAVVLLDAPTTVALGVGRVSDGSARLGVALDVAGVSVRGDTVLVIGEPSHGVAVVTSRAERLPVGPGGDVTALGPGTLVLGRLAEPVPAALAELATTTSPIRIPEPDVDRFLTRYAVALRRTLPLATDGTLDLPEAGPPRLVLHLAWQPPHTLDVTWFVSYRVGDLEVRHQLMDEHTPARDIQAERELWLGLPLPPAGTLRAREMQRLGITHGVRFVGGAAMAFVRDDVPALQAAPGVDLVVTGQAPQFREVTEAPVVEISATDRPGERDWFDLSVTVTVEGEPVAFADLFTALASGDSHLVLDTGVYLSLDSPALHRLRGLIEEARALQDRAPSEGLRINRYQADLWAELAALGVVVEQSDRWQASVRALLDADLAPPPIPVGIRADLRPYQAEGFRWLTTRYQHGLGALLADDMGLGKTLQVLAMIAHAVGAGETRPFLVVAPTSVVGSWAEQATRFAPGLRVVPVSRTQAKSSTPVAQSADGAAVVVTSYALFRLDVEAYDNVAWAGLILDEAQAIKNHRGRTHQLVRRLNVPAKFAVTGTPLENGLMEFWALLSVVAPGLYPNPERFAELVVRPVETGSDPGRLDTLRRRVRPLVLRRTKEQVAPDLPPKQEHVVHVELAPAHRRVYQTHLQRERQKVLHLIEDPQRNRFEILRSLMLLRRLALDPALVDENYGHVPATKVDILLERVHEVVAEGHRALVFSQFTGFLATVRRRLDTAGIRYAYLDGRTRDRPRRIAEFREGTAPLFLISLKAGGSGLTLTEADYVFLLDPWWNPAVEAQAVDRTHRIGQDKPVMVYRLVAADTIEEKVMALKARKSQLFDQVMDEGGLPSGPLTADDVRELLG